MEENSKEVTIVLMSQMLGTVPKNKEIYKDYIASKATDVEEAEKEAETIEELEGKGWTGFHKNDAGLFIYDYMIKGFLKAACEALQATKDLKKISAYKKWFDLLVFVRPRQIPLGKMEPDGCMERPLRSMTAQGPRNSLARSDYISEGTEITFEITVLNNSKGINWDVVEMCLGYGKYVGLGQWRGSGGYGQFEFEI